MLFASRSFSSMSIFLLSEVRVFQGLVVRRNLMLRHTVLHLLAVLSKLTSCLVSLTERRNENNLFPKSEPNPPPPITVTSTICTQHDNRQFDFVGDGKLTFTLYSAYSRVVRGNLVFSTLAVLSTLTSRLVSFHQSVEMKIIYSPSRN